MTVLGHVRKLTIEGYRSICDPIEIVFPQGVPVVLIGENNAGKSNIVRALELVLGEFYPGSHDPEDHEFHGRKKEGGLIEIEVDVTGVWHEDGYGRRSAIDRFIWRYPTDDRRPFRMRFATTGHESPYVSNEVRHQCTCIMVGADRRLSQQLSYNSKYTFISKLSKRFHAALAADDEKVKELESRYSDVESVFTSVAPFAQFQAELERQVSALSGNLAYRLGIGFSAYDPSNYFRSLRIQPKEGIDTRTIEELGTGQEQILAICLAQAYASTFHDADGLLLVIEEPEAHLHPLAQRWLATKIRELAKAGIQIVITTHSPALVDMLGLEGIVRVYREDGATCVIQRTAKDLADHWAATGSSKYDASTILPYYRAAATEEILAGLFARKVVLVEGPSEALALPVYLSQVGLHAERDGIAIISVNGVQNLAKWWRLFSAYEIPCYVIADSDPAANQSTSGQKSVLSAIGISQSEIERVLDSPEWEITASYSILPGELEDVLQRLFGERYDELDREAREEFGLGGRDAKPLRARHIASHIKLTDFPEAHQMFMELARRIASLGSSTSAEPATVNGRDTANIPQNDFDDVPFP